MILFIQNPQTDKLTLTELKFKAARNLDYVDK